MVMDMTDTQKLNLTEEWDKIFPKSEKVNHRKVTFHNRYGITRQIITIIIRQTAAITNAP